jgi:hypothetical protein
MEIDVEKYSVACGLVSQNHPNSFRDTYRRGKTRFRDFLYDRIGCSLLEAEEIVDEMERTGRIMFGREKKGSRFGMWEVRRMADKQSPDVSA